MNRVHTNIKITNNTKMNRIMVSFSDDYNSTLLIEFPTSTKMGSFMVF